MHLFIKGIVGVLLEVIEPPRRFKHVYVIKGLIPYSVMLASASYPLACAKVTDYMSVSTNLIPLFKPSRRLYNLKEYSYYTFYKQMQYKAFKEVLEVS